MFAVSTRITRYNRNYELASLSLSLVRVHVCACKCTWIYPIDVARVAQRELEGGREGVRLTTFAVTLPTQALSFDRPVDRVGYAPLQAGSR